ncbi:LysR substrate-binding domain-containing protein [Bradyrhizobium sp. USDA 4473]
MRLTNLDMDALRSFVAGIDAGSFALAANRLGRSTSAVSAQLKKLEDQADVALVRKSGRGLTLTNSGEALLSYARRLLDLNDEAISAVRGVELEGWIRLGLQEDFGETLLPQVLGRFARAHPKVRIEGRIARNHELHDKLASGQLDLALAWDDGSASATTRHMAGLLPLRWLGSTSCAPAWRAADREPLPLAMLEAPCVLRTIACEQLDRKGLAWRIAFVSPSLAGLWAAAAAGLGIAVRTPIGLPPAVCPLDAGACGLPELPSLGLVLLRPKKDIGPVGEHLAAIIQEALSAFLPVEWQPVAPVGGFEEAASKGVRASRRAAAPSA